MRQPPETLTLSGAFSFDDLTFEELEALENTGLLDDLDLDGGDQRAVRRWLETMPKTQMLVLVVWMAARRQEGYEDVTIDEVKRWPVRSFDLGGVELTATGESVGPFDGPAS